MNRSFNPSYGQMSKPFGIAAEPFEFEKHMKGVVKLEQNASYAPGGAWPMEVVLHYQDGSTRSWRGELFGTVEQFCIDHAAQLVFMPEQEREKIIVTGVDGFQRPLFPASINYESTLQACLKSALLQQKIDNEIEAKSNPKDFDSPQNRRARGLRPHSNPAQSYGSGERLMHGVVINSANEPVIQLEQELKKG